MVLVPGPKPLGQRKTDMSSIDRKFDPNYPALPYKFLLVQFLVESFNSITVTEST